MPIVRSFDGLRRGDLASRRGLRVLDSFRSVAATIALTLALACASCDRASVHAQTNKPKPLADAQTSSSPTKEHKKKPRHQDGYAVWYSVPVDSLANRRAGKGEFTAAHNHLPLGSMVRVTHLANGKSVIVRITDRGITKRGAIIDLCKPAAENLGMLSEGMARVRIEELPDDTGTDSPPDSKATVEHP